MRQRNFHHDFFKVPDGLLQVRFSGLLNILVLQDYRYILHKCERRGDVYSATALKKKKIISCTNDTLLANEAIRGDFGVEDNVSTSISTMNKNYHPILVYRCEPPG